MLTPSVKKSPKFKVGYMNTLFYFSISSYLTA